MSKNKFYITTALPYVNSDPHLGFALEMVQADVIARYHKEVLNQDVFFNTGTDEHGQKIFQKAQENNQDVQSYVDEYADKFKKLMPALGISPEIHFIRTTDAHHVEAAQEFWRQCEKNGDIYKKNYKTKYCVGCELGKTESELVDGKCPIHPNLELEIREEENYFFRWSKYQQPLLDLYQKQPDFVVPDFRFNEIKEFVKNGLEDFSVSRLKEKMSWGIPVPGDENHVMYVWFDALINYVSTLGWPPSPSSPSERGQGEGFEFQDYWPGVQIAGKDNLRQQSAMWQAMLMSAGLPNSKQIIIHGFITSGGQKMSKSLGNVADPYAIINQLIEKGLHTEQATEALRYYLLREIPTFEDGDYTWERFAESYNAGLANGIGNLTSRILKMAASASLLPWRGEKPSASEAERLNHDGKNSLIDNYQLQKYMDEIWKKVQACDEFIQKNEPFKVIKIDPEKAKKDIEQLLSKLEELATALVPVLPWTSAKIITALKDISVENIPRLFPRII